MSVHAHLTPEAEQRVRAQKRNSTISSLFVSLLVIVLILGGAESLTDCDSALETMRAGSALYYAKRLEDRNE